MRPGLVVLLMLAALLTLWPSSMACDRPPPERLAARARPPPTFKASCSTPTLGVCTEYNAEAFTLGAELLRSGCIETHGTWSPARCPLDSRVGICATDLSARLYYRRGYSSQTAAKDCAELQQGRWVEP